MPVLRGLRRSFPSAHLAWLIATPLAPLVEHDSDLDEVVLFDRRRLGRAWRSAPSAAALWRLIRRLRRERYDWVLDLQGLLRSGLFSAFTRAKVRAGFADAREGASWWYTHRIRVEPETHTVDRNIAVARALGVDARPEDFTLQLAPGAAERAGELLRQAGLPASGFLACVPPTRWTSKRYPARHWRRVLAALAGRVPIALLGGPGDREECEGLCDGLSGVANLAVRTGVAEMAAVLAAAGGTLCCDSAAKFISAAVETDAVVLIGPTRLARTGPYRLGKALLADVTCQGCLRRDCPHGTCMQAIPPGAVVSAAEAMLGL